MYRLSIFSFETIPPREVPTRLWRAVVLAWLLVAGAETAARVLLPDEGRRWQYWSPAAATQFETYRRAVEAGRPPDVVVVGDSTGASDVDPRIIRRIMNRTAYNLAYPGAFALAFRDCIAPLLLEGPRGPHVVVAMFSPWAFVDHPQVSRYEQTLVSSQFCSALRGRLSPLTEVRLTRLWAQLSKWRHGAAGPAVDTASRSGFTPMMEPPAATATPAPGATSPNAPGNAASGREPLTAERLDVLRSLVSAGRARAFRVVFVLPPLRGGAASIVDSRHQQFARSLQSLRGDEVAVLDYTDAVRDTNCFVDGIHLNERGAEELSTLLANDLRPLLAAWGVGSK